jgi:hypothetical protein
MLDFVMQQCAVKDRLASILFTDYLIWIVFPRQSRPHGAREMYGKPSQRPGCLTARTAIIIKQSKSGSFNEKGCALSALSKVTDFIQPSLKAGFRTTGVMRDMSFAFSNSMAHRLQI